jgi:signal transduction histidine kinase
VAGDQVVLAVQELQRGLVAQLLAIPAERVTETLQNWERANPLVRNVFVWDEARAALVWPDPAGARTQEEAAFAQRYAALFGGHASWVAGAGEKGMGVEGRAVQQVQAWGREYRSGRGRLREPSDSPAARSGWIPWFAEDQMQLLGWVQPEGSAQRYGVELEMNALLSRLGNTLPPAVPRGATFALVDGHGRVVHQRGVDLSAGARRTATVSLAPVLPHWEVAAYSAGADGAGVAQGLFRLLAGLLVATFAAAVVAGGSLLLWQARRDQADARRKTTFVSNVSHELKTPLTTIRMYGEMLKDGLVSDESKRLHYLDVIVRESQRLTRLVNNVLDFSRLEQGRKTYRFETLDLGALLRDTCAAQAARLQEGGLQVGLALPEAPCCVRADRDAVEQAVLNLLDNALKYAAAGGRLEIAVAWRGASVAATFRDHGPGIPREHRRRLFTQFHRVDDSLTARQPGCGLGLSISRRLMRDQGGDVVYEEAAGGGACLTIVLPAAGEETA